MGKIKFDSVKIIWKMFISFKKKNIYIYINSYYIYYNTFL